MAKGSAIHTVGRRKTSIARVHLKTGDGSVVVNGAPYDTYFERESLRMIVMQPLRVVDQEKSFDVAVNVTGGGKSGQAGAVRHGIARALSAFNQEFRSPVKKEGYLTRDAREVERKKYGRHKARKRPQYSKR